jgi:hypothetical protein
VIWSPIRSNYSMFESTKPSQAEPAYSSTAQHGMACASQRLKTTILSPSGAEPSTRNPAGGFPNSNTQTQKSALSTLNE